MIKKLKSLIVIFFIVTMISGCKTNNSNIEDWPYQGNPTIGTNQIPIPTW